MSNKINRFEDLIVWKESMKLCCDLYTSLHQCRDFNLKDQAQRSALSVPSNISEGFETQGDKVYLRHLYIAKGSCGELRTQLYIILDQRILNEAICIDFITRAKRISGMLQNMITSKKKAINGINRNSS